MVICSLDEGFNIFFLYQETIDQAWSKHASTSRTNGEKE